MRTTHSKIMTCHDPEHKYYGSSKYEIPYYVFSLICSEKYIWECAQRVVNSFLLIVKKHLISVNDQFKITLQQRAKTVNYNSDYKSWSSNFVTILLSFNCLQGCFGCLSVKLSSKFQIPENLKALFNRDRSEDP